MARPQSKIPGQLWYRAMDKLTAEKHASKIKIELISRPDISKILQYRVSSFAHWAGFQRLDFESNLDEEVKDYIESNFGRSHRFLAISASDWKYLCSVVFKRDGYTCSYCSEIGGILECDHVIPVSSGGSNDLSNLATACRRCNRQKKNKTVTEFLAWRKHKQLIICQE